MRCCATTSRHSSLRDAFGDCTERANRTLRMQIRRLTRLTDAHSKKWANHAAAVALFIAFYNFCRVHGTIKTTPAKKSGLTDHVWSIGELLTRMAESTQ